MSPSAALRQYALPIFGLALLGILVRQPIPLDETRYLAVAWEMWLNQDWLVPHLNGNAYSQKPPFLFWLINLGWQVFGVNEWWPRILPALAAWLSLGLTVKIATQLQSLSSAKEGICGREGINGKTAIALIFGAFAWPLYSSVLLFDMLMVCWTLLGWFGILQAAQRKRWGWPIAALAIGFGILTKGPVILLYVLPPALLAPIFLATGHRGLWYLKLLMSTAVGAAIALAWALPAASHGGQAYADDILWGQTAGRMKDSFSHDHPWWWYFPMLLALLLPWSFWPGFWRRLRPNFKRNKIHGFLIASVLLPFLIFCGMSGKQPHYLLPLLPLLALAVACHLDFPPISARFLRLKWLAPGIMGICMLVLPPFLLKPYHVEELAQRIHALQDANIPVLHAAKYHGDFHFLGRLEQPLRIPPRRARTLFRARRIPNGYLLISDSSKGKTSLHTPAVLQCAEFQQPYRSGMIYLIPIAKALEVVGDVEE